MEFGPCLLKKNWPKLTVVTCAKKRLPADWEELFLPKDTFMLPPDIEPFCYSCGDPCDDADFDPVDAHERRKANCAKCEPCWLCSRCRVSLLGKMDGFACCFLCVTAEGLELGVGFQANESTMRRLAFIEESFCASQIHLER